MARRVLPYVALGVVSALSGCSQWEPRPERPAWRNSVENACLAQKSVQASAYIKPAGEINGPGICGLQHPFKVSALSGGTVTLNSDQTLGCPMMPALDSWIAEVVQPAAKARFGEEVATINAMGSYSCRSIDNQRGARLSEHAFGNALDIGGFRLAGGREISIVKEWKQGDEQTRAFLRDVHAGACQYFTTVLGPGADVFHYNHIHVDLAMHGNTSTGPRRYCKPVPQNQPAPPRLDNLPDPPMIEEELDVAQATPAPPRRAPVFVSGPQPAPGFALPPDALALHRGPVPPTPIPAMAALPRKSPRLAPPPEAAGSIREDGVFVPEGNPGDWDVTSLIEKGAKR